METSDLVLLIQFELGVQVYLQLVRFSMMKSVATSCFLSKEQMPKLFAFEFV
jgi:hypothetical protein